MIYISQHNASVIKFPRALAGLVLTDELEFEEEDEDYDFAETSGLLASLLLSRPRSQGR